MQILFTLSSSSQGFTAKIHVIILTFILRYIVHKFHTTFNVKITSAWVNFTYEFDLG